MARKGYAKNGSGDEVGNNCSPQKILAAVIANRIELAMPTRRTGMENSPGILINKREVAHKAVPAANAGTLPTRPAAVPESITASPIANTRNPAATKSFPFLKNFKLSKVAAITRPRLSIPHEMFRRFGCATRVPAKPNTAPRARPTAATTFSGALISVAHCTAGTSRASISRQLGNVAPLVIAAIVAGQGVRRKVLEGQ